MKKIITVALLCIGAVAYAQQKPGMKLNLYATYTFDDKVDSYYSTTSYFDGKVKGGVLYGLGLEYMIRPEQGIELSYQRRNADAPTTYYDNNVLVDPVKTTEFDVDINYIFLGSTRYFVANPKIEPYFGGQLGVAIIGVSNPTDGSSSSSNTKFAWGLIGGTNIWFSPKAGIKLHLALQSVAQAVGGGLYFGTGGVSTGVSTYSSIIQFGVGTGLVFKFGQ